MKEDILIELPDINEKKENYIYDKSKMKKVSLKHLLLSESSKLEILFLFLGILGAIFNGITSLLLED